MPLEALNKQSEVFFSFYQSGVRWSREESLQHKRLSLQSCSEAKSRSGLSLGIKRLDQKVYLLVIITLQLLHHLGDKIMKSANKLSLESLYVILAFLKVHGTFS